MTNSSALSFRYRWVILGICWLAFTMVFVQRLSIAPLAPFIKEDLNLTSAQVGLFMSAVAFGYMLTLIPAGWAVDRLGVRKMLLMGELVGGIFITGMFLVSTFAVGIFLLVLIGLGLGAILPANTKATVTWFPVKERATALGFIQTGINLGGLIASTTLPTLALALSWQQGFVSIGLATIATGIIAFLLYREPPQSVSLNTSELVKPSGPKPSVQEVFRDREIWMVSLAGTCMAAVEFSIMTHFVLYSEEALLFSVVTAGFFLAILQAGGLLSKPLSGLVSDRLFRGGRKKPYIIMCCITCVMCLVFAFLQPASSSLMLIPFCLILGFVALGWGGIHVTFAGEFGGRELVGTMAGVSVAFLQIGIIVGPPIFGYIVDATGSYQVAWQLLAILAAVAVALLVLVREEKRRI